MRIKYVHVCELPTPDGDVLYFVSHSKHPIDLDSSPNLFLSGSCSQKSPGQVGAYRGMKVMK